VVTSGRSNRAGDSQVGKRIPRHWEKKRDLPLDALVWKGAIAAAELQIEIERVWQSGSGKWFAVLESLHSSDERNVTDVRHVEHRECDGEMAAVVGCRELLAKHAGLFSEDATIEAKIQSSLEWRPPIGAG
jgi:hypothetical protein